MAKEVVCIWLLMASGLSYLIAQTDHKYALGTKQEAFIFSSENERFVVYLLKDNHGFATYYSTNLTGEVCLDGLCRPINVDIYWDLLGNFADYATTEENRLTKFDHVAFTPE